MLGQTEKRLANKCYEVLCLLLLLDEYLVTFYGVRQIDLRSFLIFKGLGKVGIFLVYLKIRWDYVSNQFREDWGIFNV